MPLWKSIQKPIKRGIYFSLYISSLCFSPRVYTPYIYFFLYMSPLYIFPYICHLYMTIYLYIFPYIYVFYIYVFPYIHWESVRKVNPGSELAVHPIHIDPLLSISDLRSSAWHGSTSTHIFCKAFSWITECLNIPKILIDHLV